MPEKQGWGDIRTGSVSGIGIAIGHNARSHVEIHNNFSAPTHFTFTQHGLQLEVNPSFQADVTPAFTPHAASDVPELRRLIGHAAELAYLGQLYQQAQESGCGRIVFLTSEEGYGRQALGRAFVDAVRKMKGNAAIGRFWPDGTEQFTWKDTRWQFDLEQMENRLQGQPPGGEYLQSAELAPLKAILAQLFSEPQWLHGQISLPAAPKDLPEIFRNMTCGRKPVVVLLEDFEYASPEWDRLLSYLEPELRRDLPVVLVVCLHARLPLDQLPVEEQTHQQRLALRLAQDGQGEVYHLSRVSQADIAHYLAPNPAAPELVGKLADLTDGVPMLIERLWDDLLRQKEVFISPEGQWELRRSSPYLAFGSVRDLVLHLFDASWPVEDEPPFSREQMLAMLACAAREGSTFTLEALAYAFECDPRLLENEFDCLLDDPDCPDQPGLLVDDGKQVIEWEPGKLHKELVQYRFQPLLGWHVFSKYYEVEPQRLARLADGLVRAHAPFVERAAGTAARLYRLAGRAEEAERYRLLLEPRHSYDALLQQIWILQNLLGEGTSVAWRVLELMAKLSDTAYLYNHSRDGVKLYGQMLELAQRLGSKFYQAFAYLMIGRAVFHQGLMSEAERYFLSALALFEQVEHPDGIASTLDNLGQAARFQGKLEQAEDYYRRALAAAERAGQEEGIASTLSNLGNIAKASEQLELAKEYYQRSIQLFKRLQRDDGVAVNLINLGEIAKKQGQLEQAEQHNQQALALGLKSDREDVIAISLENLGNIACDRGLYRQAEEFYLQVLNFYKKHSLSHKVTEVLGKLDQLKQRGTA